jgi:hypothetical protein
MLRSSSAVLNLPRLRRGCRQTAAAALRGSVVVGKGQMPLLRLRCRCSSGPQVMEGEC